MAALELILVLLAAVALLALLAEKLEIPLPALLVLGGIGLALAPGLPRPSLDPDAVFLIFVPPLLYWTALNTSWRDFRENLRSITLLSVGLVIVTMIAVAAAAHAVTPELPWASALVLGAIVSPPDPVAVTAVTRKLGVPRGIVTLLEGEGLVNDATALVAYRMAVAAVVTGTSTIHGAGLKILWAGAGGVAVGLAVGLGIGWLRRKIGRAPVVENTISLLTPFAAFIPAERLGVSGVLAVVAVGLYLGRRGPRIVSPQTRLQATGMWQVVSFLLEGLIFILIGLELPFVLEALRVHPPELLVELAAAVAGAAIVVRMLWVFPGAYVPRYIQRWLGAKNPDEFPPWQGVTFVGWAGLRGGDSLVIALALPLKTAAGAPFPGRDLILFLTFAVIFVTLVLQGFTLKFVIRWLGLKPDRETGEEETEARDRVTAAGLARLAQLKPENDTQREILEGLREKHTHIAHRFDAHARGKRHEKDEARRDAYRKYRLEMIRGEREELVGLRDENVISDGVMRRIQRDLDLEQVLLESPDAVDAELDGRIGVTS
jgi:CPA1 family monovalent cation:H+ antiporter